MQIQYADGISRIGGVKWTIALALFGVFFVVYFALWKGIKSSGKVRFVLGVCLSLDSWLPELDFIIIIIMSTVTAIATTVAMKRIIIIIRTAQTSYPERLY